MHLGVFFSNFLLLKLQVQYERVNLADIETSSEEDDYGDLFAKVIDDLVSFFLNSIIFVLIMLHLSGKKARSQ